MKIVYMITNHCNANCPHCYNRRIGVRNEEKNLKECELDIISLQARGCEVVVAGNEVLCDPEKISLYQIAGQKYLLSNGIILAKNPLIFSKLEMAGISEVYLSWHYNFPDLSGQFTEEITFQAIDNAKRNNFEVHLNCVVGSKNFNSLEALCEKAVERGVREVNFLKLLPMSDEMRKFRLTDSQTKIVFNTVMALREKYSKDVICVRLHANFNSELTKKSSEAKRDGFFCPAGKEFLAIATNGDIYPCPFLQEDRFWLGNFDNGIIKIKRSMKNDGRNCLAEKLYNTNAIF